MFIRKYPLSMPNKSTRREFLRSSALLTGASVWSCIHPESLMNEPPRRVALIGTGWYGKSDLFKLMQVANCDIRALCDVDSRLLQEAQSLVLGRTPNKPKPALYKDYRDMLMHEELDIVLIGTPDHWHALQAIDAISAGAHVYLQKPISVDVLEGEAILRAARVNHRVVQIGMQRRSTPHLQEAKKNIIDAGLLGKVAHVEMCCYYSMRSLANPPLQAIPDYLDYELWTGPAPYRPYDGLPHRGWWRAFMEYSNGIVGDMCVHMFDAVRWLLDLRWPHTIESSGGTFVQKQGKSNTSDTQTAIFHYDELSCVWQHRSWGTPPDPEYPWAFFIYGEKGTLKADVHKYEFIPTSNEHRIKKEVVLEKDLYPEDLTEKDIEIHTAPATRGQMKNFLESIDNQNRPIADIEEGYISTASCILANMSMKLRRPLRYDPDKKIVINDEEATKLLCRDYRKGYVHPADRKF